MARARKAKAVYTSDFETTTTPDDCRVWAWATCNVEDYAFEHGNTLEGWFLWCSKHPDVDIYFHNLAFDGKFVVDALLKGGYAWTSEKAPTRGTFNTLVSSTGRFYSIGIRFLSGARVTLKDSLKVFPMSVARIAKAFELPEPKGELDYESFRPVGHALTDDELDYIRRDVEIVARALHKNFEQGLTKMTIGSNAFTDYKGKLGKQRYKALFPVLSLETDALLRKAYRGGFTYVEPRWAGVDVLGGLSVDYNSMYPSMLVSKPYPVGVPEWYDGKYARDTQYPLFMQQLTCTFALKPDGIPMVQLKGGRWGLHEYVRECDEPVSLSLTSVDLELFFANYDVDVWSWDGGFKFMSIGGDYLFGDYIWHWGEVKASADGPMRQIAKLMLNNLYGKFATNPDVTPKVPVLEEDGIVHWHVGAEDTRDPVYVPVGAFCTAYARHTLITAIHANRERFVYCDTDSLHLAGIEEPSGIRLHDSDLCAWKVEGTFTRARHLRAKCYIWDLGGRLGVACAGMPANVKELCTFDNFRYGFTNTDSNGRVLDGYGKLTPVAVAGGVVLEPRRYELRSDKML